MDILKETDKNIKDTELKNREKIYRYDLIGSDLEFGVKEHPQKQMKKLGFNVVKAEPCVIADCWFFKVDNDIADVPEYLTKVNYEWD